MAPEPRTLPGLPGLTGGPEKQRRRWPGSDPEVTRQCGCREPAILATCIADCMRAEVEQQGPDFG